MSCSIGYCNTKTSFKKFLKVLAAQLLCNIAKYASFNLVCVCLFCRISSVSFAIFLFVGAYCTLSFKYCERA